MKHYFPVIFILLMFFTACDQSLEKWELAKSEDTIESYEKFIAEFPNNVLVDSAKLALNTVHYKIAHSKNTIPAYEEFLKNVPEGTLAEKAKSDIEVILNDRHPAFKNVKTIKWVVKELTPDSKYVAKWLLYPITILFKPSGITIDESDSLKCDATITINMAAKAIGASYSSFSSSLSGYHYTGAELKYELILEGPNNYKYEKKFKTRLEPSGSIVRSHETPAETWWNQAIVKSRYPEVMFNLFCELYGKSGFVNLSLKNSLDVFLKDYDFKNGYEAKLKNYDMGYKDIFLRAMKEYDLDIKSRSITNLNYYKDSTVVPILMHIVLNDNHERLRAKACEQLGSYIELCPTDLFLKALEDEYYDVRVKALNRLGQKKDPSTFKKTLELLFDEDIRVRECADKTLAQITGNPFSKDRFHENGNSKRKKIDWERWWSENGYSLQQKYKENLK